MTRERLDSLCEKGILIVVLVVLIFGPLATGAVRPFEFLIIQGLTMVTTLLWLFRFWLNPNHRILWPPICWAVLAFVGYAIIRYQQADIEYVARQELIRILIYAFLFFAVLNNVARQETTQIISCVMIFLAMAISMYAIYQFATDSQYVWHFIKPESYRKRGSGTYICPNHLAGFLEMLLPLGLSYALTGRLGHLLRVFVSYASLVVLAGIGVTISRGGWVATIAALLLFFVLLIRRRQYRIPALAVLILLGALGGGFYLKAERAQRRFVKLFAADRPETGQGRFWIWRPAKEMWDDHFWLGVGPAHFDYRFPAYRPPELQARVGYAHNDYLQTLVDWGLTGMTIIAAALALLFAGVFRTWRFVRREGNALGAKNSNRSAFVFGASIGLLAILIHSFGDFNMQIPANAILAVTLMALLSGHLRFATESYWIRPGRMGGILATMIGLIGLIYFGDQGWRRAQENAWLERAGEEKSYTRTRLDALKRAAAIEPMNFETVHEIGETLRQMSWQGDRDYQTLAQEAIQWFRRGVTLNPFDPYNYMRMGMCLDWLGHHVEAASCFEKSVNRDPNNYYVLVHQGWHFVQVEDYSQAKRWFERSLELNDRWRNPIAWRYLEIVNDKLKESPATMSPDRRSTQ